MSEVLALMLEHDGYVTSYLKAGDIGRRAVLIHGSGPGVSARANWQGTLASSLAHERQLVAPDVLGFGDTSGGPPAVPDHDARVAHLLSFLQRLGDDPVDLIGNSMGGALALALAARAPERVRSLVLMGTVGIDLRVTPGLAKVWGYQPSIEAMEELIGIFAFDRGLITPDLVRLRYEASIRPGVQERYSAAFGPPFQRHADAMALPESVLRSIDHPTLLFHGVDDQVIPLEDTSLRLVRLLPAAQLVAFSHCGHWTQIERSADFVRHVAGFLGSLDAADAGPPR